MGQVPKIDDNQRAERATASSPLAHLPRHLREHSSLSGGLLELCWRKWKKLRHEILAFSQAGLYAEGLDLGVKRKQQVRHFVAVGIIMYPFLQRCL